MEVELKKRTIESSGAVVNPCKACAPLGASLAMKGIRDSMCILHGSQGCATYIRRYFIGHFREPVDIASSSFDESTAVFGGRENLIAGIRNLVKKYNPAVIGIATSCLAETIGEDVGMYMRELENLPEFREITFIHTDTAAYKGTHINGFMKMSAAAAELARPYKLAETGESSVKDERRMRINVIPWMVSPADIRNLKRIFKSISTDTVFLPDYSLTLDGGIWSEYEAIPAGGTSIEEIRSMGTAVHTIQFGPLSSGYGSPAAVINRNCGTAYTVLPLPIGLKNTDRLINLISEIAAANNFDIHLPLEMAEERGRLLDAYADAHKYFTGMKAAVYGEADFVLSMAGFLCELGIEPAVCLTGENITPEASAVISEMIESFGFAPPAVLADSDFYDLDEAVERYKPDLMIGNSRGYKTSRKYKLPLVRAGFPVQDRFGGQRLLHLGYEGGLRLTDEIANTIIAGKQAESSVGYMSM